MGRGAQINRNKAAPGGDTAFSDINRKRYRAGLASRVLIIGGGPAGLTAAIAASRAGADVAIADRMSRVGKKLLASGNGRCNLSNASVTRRNYHGSGAEAAYSIINKFDKHFVNDFFKSVGVLTAIEDQSRVYPATFSSQTVLNALRAEAGRLGVVEMCAHEAFNIKFMGKKLLTSFRDKPGYLSDAVVIATGGKASPFLGSDGSGYGLLTAFGHGIVAPSPALAPLRLAEREIRGLKGVRVRAGLTLIVNGDGGVYREAGELIFSEYGVSGIPALNASCHMARYAHEARRPGFTLSLDLFPDLSFDGLKMFLEQRLNHIPQIPFIEILNCVSNKRVAALVLERAGINDNRAPGAGCEAYAVRLAEILKDWRIEVTGVKGFESAQATYGGLSFADFSADTLESKLVTGIYAAGEVLDATGDCGGYNLHWAWISGYLAGMRAARAPSVFIDYVMRLD